MEKISMSFKSLNDAALLGKTENILAAMTANVNFPTPVPSLVNMQTAFDAYTAALNAAQYRDRLAVVVKNQKKDELLTLLQQLANYVNLTANGDLAMLASSGMDIVSTNMVPVSLSVPQNFKADNGVMSGELWTSITTVDGARMYQHQYTDDPQLDEKNWVTVQTTTCRNRFIGLEPGKKYFLRIAALGTNQQVVYTDVISRIVL